MSELKSFVAGYKSFIARFIPYVPDDNSQSAIDSVKVLHHNINALQHLLKSNILVFVCEICRNDTLITFIESYLQSRHKPYEQGSGEPGFDFQLSRLVCLVFVRLLSTTEVDQLIQLLPAASIAVAGKGVSTNGSADTPKDEDPQLKRKRSLEEQYRQLVANVAFARAPQVMDIVSLLGDTNRSIAARVIDGFCAVKPSGQKELADCVKQSITAMEQVQQAMIVLSRRVQELRQPRRSGVKPSTTKVSGLSVVAPASSAKRGGVSGGERSPHSGGAKMTAAAELLFLCEFAADIVYTLAATLAASGHIENCLGVRCLAGTHLTGSSGMPLLRALQNLYEVFLPLAARTAALEAVDVDLSVTRVRRLLRVVQTATLRVLHDQLATSAGQIDAAVRGIGGQRTLSDLYDSADVLREDAVDWMAFFNGFDPLGRDILVLTASSANAGETASGKLLTPAGSSANAAVAHATHSKASLTTGGVVHTVEEGEVLRGAYLTDYLKVYGPEVVVSVLWGLLGKRGDSERVDYVLASLQGSESLLKAPVVKTRAQAPALPQAGGKSASALAQEHKQLNQLSQEEMVANLKALFPDLGEGFIEACIAAYKGNMEEIVDALLTNNLQPKLLMLDRGLKKVWIGKGGNAARDTVSLDAKKRDAAMVYQAVEDANFKQLQLERVRKMEAEQEYDAMLLSREYNDDYDDQYDDQIVDPLKVNVYGDSNPAATKSAPATHAPAERRPAAPPAPEPVILNRRDRRKLKDSPGALAAAVGAATVPVLPPPPPAPTQQTKAMIHQQMAEMKRLNTLTKEAEVEAAYWEGMRNTNRPGASTAGKGSWKAELARQAAEAEAAAVGEGQAGGTGPAAQQRGHGQGQGQSQGQRGGRPNQGSGQPQQSGQKQAPGQQQVHGQGQGQQSKSQPKAGNNTQGTGRPPKENTTGGGGGAKGGNANANKAKGSDSAGDAASETTEEGKKKHRTKPFDKHHQKDRSTRKFAHFAPST